MFQLRRVQHFLVVLVESRTVDHVVHPTLGSSHGVVLFVLESIAVTELQEGLEGLAFLRVLVTLHAQGRRQTIERRHLTTLVRVPVLTVLQSVLLLLEIRTLNDLLELIVLRQF